jgi:hypothetical protein
MSFAFNFARHFFQPCGIGRAGDQSAQLGGNRRFPRWFCLAVSLQLGPSAAAQGIGGHVISVDSSRDSLSFPETRELQSGCRGALAAAQGGLPERGPPEGMVNGRGGGSPAQLSHLEPRNTPATRCAAGWRSRNADQDSLGMAGGSNLWKGGSPSVATVASVAGGGETAGRAARI